MRISDKTAYNLLIREFSSKSAELELSAETRRRVFIAVIIGHLMFFTIPFIVSYINRYLKPKKPPVITIKLFEEKKAVPQPQPPKTEPKKEEAKPEFPKPEPKPETPKPEPPKPQPPKPQVKPEPKPEPKVEKPVVKVPEEKPQPKKPEWRPKTPNEIVVSKEVIKVDKPKTPEVDPAKIRERLMNIQSQMKVTPAPSTAGAPTATQPPADYFDRVASVLYDLWVQPSKMELRGAKPRAIVSIRVDGSGKVLSANIKSRSGIAAMDNSVEQLLRNLTSLPPPPSGGISFDVSLEIKD